MSKCYFDNSVITCEGFINAVETKTVTKNFNEKNAICKTKRLLALLLINIALLAAD